MYNTFFTFFIFRLLWVIVVGLAVSFAIFLSNGAYQNWKSSPVLTTVWTTGHPIEQVPFPSVTICAQGSVNEIIGKLYATKLIRKYDISCSKVMSVHDISDIRNSISVHFFSSMQQKIQLQWINNIYQILLPDIPPIQIFTGFLFFIQTQPYSSSSRSIYWGKVWFPVNWMLIHSGRKVFSLCVIHIQVQGDHQMSW